MPYLQDHQVFNTVIFPGAGYVEMMLAAGKTTLNQQGKTQSDLEIPRLTLIDLSIESPLALALGQETCVQVVLSPEEEDSAYQVAIYSQASAADNLPQGVKWYCHARGKLIFSRLREEMSSRIEIAATQQRCQEIAMADFYNQIAERGISYGPCFQGIQKRWEGEGEVLVELDLSRNDTSHQYCVHPALLDSGFQALMSAFLTEAPTDVVYLPVGIHKIIWYQACPISSIIYAHASWSKEASEVFTGQIDLYDLTGCVLLSVKDFYAKAVSRQVLLERLGMKPTMKDWFYTEGWQIKSGSEPLMPVELVDYIPSFTQLVPPLQEEWNRLSKTHHLEKITQALPLLDGLSTCYVCQALYAFGWQPRLGQTIVLRELMVRGAVQLQHQRLFKHLLIILQTDGYLEASSDSDTWKVIRLPESGEALNQKIQDIQTRLKQDYHELYNELGLLSRCGKELALVMQGKQEALSLLFPEEGSPAYEISAAQLYRTLPMIQASNALVQQALREALKTASAQSRPIRLLEVGAGTGGTTSAVLPVLAELGLEFEYTFTDVSFYFLDKAKTRFSQYKTITYQLLDIEKDPKTQGFPPYQYDLVLAANVLHATRDIDETLANVRHLLAPEGLLVLLEGVEPMRWMDLIFGLLEGWWRFEDEHRLLHPLLTGNQWQNLLSQHAFRDSCVLGEQQAVILGRADATRPVYPFATQVPWLILMKENDLLGEDLRQSLESLGELVVTIVLSESNKSEQFIQKNIFLIRHSQSHEEFRSLFKELRLNERDIKGILYLWSKMDKMENDLSEIIQVQERSCGGLLTLIQTLNQLNLIPQQKLMIVTCGARCVLPGEQMNPASGHLMGDD